ncbi:MAG: hypothetical protein M1825_005457 [Sarcosagium campestre]|nr:MAG: hypothetical protein M1825_005457 [Sarcosagium campestre]
MRFGLSLRNTIYSPWKEHYIDYSKLKGLLRESPKAQQDRAESKTAEASQNDGGDDAVDDWTESDEGAFVEELINVQLEKVNSFQVKTYGQLRDRTTKCESTLEKLLIPTGKKDGATANGADADADANSKSKDEDGAAQAKTLSEDERQRQLKEVLNELDSITKETNELEKFSRINFTGFLKAAKKHDRRRGRKYRMKPLVQVRLAALPFNSEDYSPLLYRLSSMYSFVRQNMDGYSKNRPSQSSDSRSGGEKYTSYKFWVHPDNLLEVKTYILRRLPVLVYNPQTSKVAEGAQKDPKITSLYFDNAKFALYTQKVERAPDASSLRLRWYGELSEQPEILLEEKIMKDDDRSEERRFPIKDKFIQPFLKGEYKMEKSIQKLEEQHGKDSTEVEQLKKTVDAIQTLVKEHGLQPVLRANYTRTAFQIPGDSRVRISLDTNLVLVREDSLDEERPSRDPSSWHRADLDAAGAGDLSDGADKADRYRFPFALLEIKIRQDFGKKRNEWVSDLMDSHLLKEAPRFSKFVHGVAQLFEDSVNSFPFWLGEMEGDIRKDPAKAFEKEQEKKAKRAEDELAVGSFLGSPGSPAFKPAEASPVDKSPLSERKSSVGTDAGAKSSSLLRPSVSNIPEEGEPDDDGAREEQQQENQGRSLRSRFNPFPASYSKYARAHRAASLKLPPGVSAPGSWIKDSGPVQVEPKVWLANQRTFIKWQHVAVLLASLSLGLFNAAGRNNNVARGLAVVYTVVAAFAAGWGWWMYIVRSRLIRERSGKDFDNVLGPVVVCLWLVAALCLNFFFKYRAVMAERQRTDGSYNGTRSLDMVVDAAQQQQKVILT